MTKTGIDQIALYTPRYALKLADLARARSIDPLKFTVGLGQEVMSVPPPGEDIVTLAANAGLKVLQNVDKSKIDMLLFATESGIDQSKSAGIYVHDLLKLPARCRVLELKQACYSATGGLQLAMSYLRENPEQKVLLIASDIARYGLESVGESSQGAAACAMILSANPRLIAFEKAFGVVVENVMDFWRPNYRQEALVDGKYSSRLYLQMLEKSFKQYQAIAKRDYHDHDYFCYHTPVPRLVEKAHLHLLKLNDISPTDAQKQQAEAALFYGKQMGNSYTASLYVSLACLLDLTRENLAGKRIGFYSYGSGCVAEFFSGIVEDQYERHLFSDYHQELLTSRKYLSYAQYVDFYNYTYNEAGLTQDIPQYNCSAFRLAKLENHKRCYESVSVVPLKGAKVPAESAIKIAVPAKVILSGEHAILYGSPAIAMAVNRFTTATITQGQNEDISFDFADIAYQRSVSLDALSLLKARLKEKYHRFIKGEYSIRQVLRKPFELAQFALSILADSPNIQFPQGMKVRIDSQIPIGCGMGSSAATILAVLHALSTYLHLPLSHEALLKLAREAENMQHGISSGLDLYIAQNGGCVYVHQNEMRKRPVPSLHEQPLYLVNTGTPLNTTGECVEKVKPYFHQPGLVDAFTEVTQLMDQALERSYWAQFKEAMRANHLLLKQIKVVPQKVDHFITAIEKLNGAAKVCGAGAIAGDHAGIVLIACDEEKKLQHLCETYHYSLSAVSPEIRGVHAA